MPIPRERISTHPRVVLLEEYIKPLGLSHATLGKELGISTNRLNVLVRGEARNHGQTRRFALHAALALRPSSG